MPDTIQVSTPSRLCLFGEHQDYLGLEVIAAAIDLRFYAALTCRPDRLIRIAIRECRCDRLDSTNEQQLYEHTVIDLSRPIVYENSRDYLKSSVRVLQKFGCELTGFDIRLDSEIPIGKGMCSSSTMIVVLIKALLEGTGHPAKDQPRQIAELAFQAEVAEFNEPGGRMDHYTSALGGLVHLDFGGDFSISQLDARLNGCFLLFDSLEQKDTTRVLAASKIPAQAALAALAPWGITSVRDFLTDPDRLSLLKHLEEVPRRKLQANIENSRLLQLGLRELTRNPVDDCRLGQLLTSHHAQLRDGLGISTPTIERILDTALAAGAYGGKINGSGGGGCCFVYARPENAAGILAAVGRLGYPGRQLRLDTGVRRDDAKEARV